MNCGKSSRSALAGRMSQRPSGVNRETMAGNRSPGPGSSSVHRARDRAIIDHRTDRERGAVWSDREAAKAAG